MTMTMARAKYEEKGGHFFDRATMRFFGSRIESELYSNRCFITSEKNYDGRKRYYNVRRFSEDFGDVETVGDFNVIRDKKLAREIAKEVK